MLCAMAGKFLNSFFTMPFLGSITHHIASEDNGWNLILVNHDNYIPADYKVQLTELSNGKKVDSRIYPELQEMFDDARAQGYSLFVREGYRTQEEQQQLMDEKIEVYENEGKSKSEAKKLADKLTRIMVKVEVKAGENGKIFGGVSAKEIADNLEKQHSIKIDKKKIDLKETIKTLGTHIVDVKLYEGVYGKIKIDVIEK